jgi:hypothetical protein
MDDPVYRGKRISGWISELAYPPPQSSNAAAALIASGGSSVPQLTRNLGSPVDMVKEVIPVILGKIGPAAIDAVVLLNNGCNDSNPVVAIGVRFALAMITGDVDKHLPSICTHLASADPDTRGHAAQAVGMLGPQAMRAPRMLFEMRQNEKNQWADMMASQALDRIGWNPALGAMGDVDFY